MNEMMIFIVRKRPMAKTLRIKSVHKNDSKSKKKKKQMVHVDFVITLSLSLSLPLYLSLLLSRSFALSFSLISLLRNFIWCSYYIKCANIYESHIRINRRLPKYDSHIKTRAHSLALWFGPI